MESNVRVFESLQTKLKDEGMIVISSKDGFEGYERAKKEIADTVPTIIKSVEDFGNQVKTEQITNAVDTIVTKDKAFNVLNDSISNLKNEISNAKNLSQKEKAIFEFLKYELAG